MKSLDEDFQSQSDKDMDLMFQQFKEFLRHKNKTSKLQKQSKERPTFREN